MLKRILTHKAVRGSFLTTLDQGIVSISNFLTGVLVARAVSPEDFGTYSLMFTGLIVLYGLQNALIVGPARVLGVRASGVDASGYFASQLQLQFILGSILSTAVIVLLPAATSMTLSMSVTFSVCLFFFQLQELIRIINLTRFTLVTLLLTDTLTHGLRIALLVSISLYGTLSPSIAVLTIAISCAIGAIPHLKKKDRGLSKSVPLRETMSSNWEYGRWLLLETMAYTASTQVYLYFTAYWVDKQSAGALNAIQNLLNVVNILHIGIMSFAIPTARNKLIEYGHGVWKRWFLQVGIALTVSTTLIVLILSTLAKPLLSTLYSPFYGNYAYLVPVLGLSYCLAAVNTVFGAAYYTARLPQVGLVARTATAVLTLTLAYPALQEWGVKGAAIGLLATQALWTAVYLTYMAKGSLGPDRVKLGI